MRIGLSIDSFTPWLGGVEHFLTLSESLRLAASESGAEVMILATATGELRQSLGSDVRVVPCASIPHTDPLAVFTTQTRFTQLVLVSDLAAGARHLGLDLLGPHVTEPDFPVPCWAYLRDLQHCLMPQRVPEAERQQRDDQLRRLASDNRLMLVDSAAVLSELIRRVPGMQAKTHAIPQLWPRIPDRLPSEATVRTLFGLDGPYFVASAQQQWAHERHEIALEALALVGTGPGVGPKLVVTGRRGDYRQPDHRAIIDRIIVQRGLGRRVHHVGYVDRTLQLALIEHATALVQTSGYAERPGSAGVAEAVCLGTPAIASGIPVNRELAGGELIRYFQSDSPQELAALLQDALLRKERGVRRSAADLESSNRTAGAQLYRLLTDAIHRA